MAGVKVFIDLDQNTLVQIARLSHSDERMEIAIMNALDRSIDIVATEAEDYMDTVFMNATGQMSGSLQKQLNSPKEAQVWSEIPYAQRLHFGFSGKTDSLGRYYPYWPAYYWADEAVALAYDEVEWTFFEEMELAANGA